MIKVMYGKNAVKKNMEKKITNVFYYFYIYSNYQNCRIPVTRTGVMDNAEEYIWSNVISAYSTGGF